MHDNVTWIVVANSCHAKLYQVVKFPKLQEINHLEHPESRLLDQDLISTPPGRTFQSGGVTRHAYQAKSDPKQQEADKFAKDLSDLLSSASQQGKYGRLYVFANHSFLGLLRHHFDEHIRKAIIAEVPKDMTECSVPELEHHLSEL